MKTCINLTSLPHGDKMFYKGRGQKKERMVRCKNCGKFLSTMRSDDIYIQCDSCATIVHFVSEELLYLKKKEKENYDNKDREEEEELHSI